MEAIKAAAVVVAVVAWRLARDLFSTETFRIWYTGEFPQHIVPCASLKS